MVKGDSFLYLTGETGSVPLPVPPSLHNDGEYTRAGDRVRTPRPSITGHAAAATTRIVHGARSRGYRPGIVHGARCRGSATSSTT